MMKKLVILGLAGQKAKTEDTPARIITARSGMLDADSLLAQAEMFMAPDAFKRFRHFYTEQVDSNDRYGCHCQMKNMVSQDYIDYQYENGEKKQYPYSGQAVDDLDRACHNHRECLRCAQMELGCANDGISEHYLNYSLSRIGTCYDKSGTCKRAYCECAQQFIEDLNSNAIFRYTPERFSKRRAGFDANEYTCARRDQLEELGFSRREHVSDESGEIGEKKEKRRVGCCSKSNNGDAPWRLYNKDKFKCCEDGSVSLTC